MRGVWNDAKLILRAVLLLLGVGCLFVFWDSGYSAIQQNAWATYAAALFLLVIALKD